MAQNISLETVYHEIKQIEKNMLTKQEVESFLTTLEILSNPKTMKQLKESEEDIKLGRVKEIKSAREI